jgi:anti-sigma regulatory factor (Ser/Thr protein kinase)
VLERWHLLGHLDSVLVVVSELVTNAVRHGRAPIALSLQRGQRSVRVEVQDSSPHAPTAREVDDDAECGRGLLIVRSLSSATGVDYLGDDGKVTWADIDNAVDNTVVPATVDAAPPRSPPL